MTSRMSGSAKINYKTLSRNMSRAFLDRFAYLGYKSSQTTFRVTNLSVETAIGLSSDLTIGGHVADTTDDNLRRKPAQDRSAQRLTLILDTTARLIDEVGQSGLTPALIARNAEMSGPAIYRYFADIDAIVGALAARNLELFLEATADLLADPDLTWEGAVEGSVSNFSRMYREVPGFRTLGLGGGSGAVFREGMSNKAVVAAAAIQYFKPRFEAWDRPLFQEHVEAMIEIIEALVRRAFEPGANTEFFLGEATRVGIQYLGDFLTNVPGTPPADA